MNNIKKSVIEFLNSVPPDVLLVVASKTRTPEEVQAAINTGIEIIGL